MPSSWMDRNSRDGISRSPRNASTWRDITTTNRVPVAAVKKVAVEGAEVLAGVEEVTEEAAVEDVVFAEATAVDTEAVVEDVVFADGVTTIPITNSRWLVFVSIRLDSIQSR